MPWPQLFFALFGVASPLVPAPQRSPRTLLQKPSSQPTLRWRGESRANSSQKWISGARKKSDLQGFLGDYGLLENGFARKLPREYGPRSAVGQSAYLHLRSWFN